MACRKFHLDGPWLRREHLFVLLFFLPWFLPLFGLQAASNPDLTSSPVIEVASEITTSSQIISDPDVPVVPLCEPLLTRTILTRTLIRNTSSGESFGERLKLHFSAEDLEDLTWQSQTTPEENAYWMNISQQSDEMSRRTAFVFEVPVVKQMNDGILVGQKRLVNVLLNFLKATLKTTLVQLLPTGLSLHWYSDFKSLGLIVEQTDSDTAISEFALRSLITEAATATLSKFDQLIGITAPHMGFYRSVNPHSWLKVGGGRSPQFASVAARLARYIHTPDELSSQKLIWFHDEGQFYIATHILSELEVRRDLVIDILSSHYPALLVLSRHTPVVGWHDRVIRTLHPEVFKTLRSADSLDVFHDVLIIKFPQLRGGLEDFVAHQIWNYYQLQDQLSPPIYFRDRNYANLTQGDVGGAAVDFVGLGALNSMAVDLALAEYFQNPTTHPSDLIMLIQKRERELTTFVERQRAAFTLTLGNILSGLGSNPGEFTVTCSADDCALSFYTSQHTSAEAAYERSQKLIDPLLLRLQNMGLRAFRIVMIGNMSTPPSQKDILVGHGESLEKKWRHRLYELGLTVEEQHSLQAIFVMKGAEAGYGVVDIHYVTNRTGDKALHNLLGQALKDALGRTNEELHTYYEPGHLTGGENLPPL